MKIYTIPHINAFFLTVANDRSEAVILTRDYIAENADQLPDVHPGSIKDATETSIDIEIEFKEAGVLWWIKS